MLPDDVLPVNESEREPKRESERQPEHEPEHEPFGVAERLTQLVFGAAPAVSLAVV